jgi:outer membrane protein OmpA-like peptidoglycan-associated protein
MKALVVSILLLISFESGATSYVVIGAFAEEHNAIKLQQRVKNAVVDVNSIKHLYYVFTFKTEDHQEALNEAVRLQKETEFKDAWVFSGTLGKNTIEGEPFMEKPVVVNDQPVVGKEPVVEKAAETPVTETPPPSTSESKTDVALDPKINIKDFYFNVIREDGSKADGAEITVIDPTTQRKELTFTGNQNVAMKAINKSGDVRFECDLAGYRKIVQSLNFKDPSTADGIKIENNRIIVPFHLVRLKKGDIAILYNVFFYKDAAIMRPESKFDLNGVLTMMQDNPTYKIKIHGHTNGNASGPILEAGESGNFFTLTGAKEGNGSAKKLSQKRADAIRDYLAKEGIDPTRLLTKAWGGKKPIYDKHSTTAYANVRVEVEVIDE